MQRAAIQLNCLKQRQPNCETIAIMSSYFAGVPENTQNNH